MYLFICRGTPQHFSYSASKEQYDQSCPECGEPSKLVEGGRLAENHNLSSGELFSRAQKLNEEGYSETSVAHILRLDVTELRALRVQERNRRNVEIGKTVLEMKDQGYSNAAIASDLGVHESSVRQALEGPDKITARTNIWFPGPDYVGREEDYAKTVGELPDSNTVALVQKRAQEDGEWAIENGLVANHMKFMRKMMDWVADSTNITQCLEHLYKDEEAHIRTVDWVCRDLANASKAIVGGIARD